MSGQKWDASRAPRGAELGSLCKKCAGGHSVSDQVVRKLREQYLLFWGGGLGSWGDGGQGIVVFVFFFKVEL